MGNLRSLIDSEINELSIPEKRIINEVWEHRAKFVQWPTQARLFWEGCVRVRYHQFPEELKRELRSKGIRLDSRSNGPAIAAFVVSGGRRPRRRSNPNQQWHVHHIYDGKFRWPEKKETLHAVKNGRHFTQSAGLVAVHPIAEALTDEYFSFAWQLRHESFLRFNYDPDKIFGNETDEYGFKIS